MCGWNVYMAEPLETPRVQSKSDRLTGQELIIYEDEHLLVVNKPAGLNTHAPSLFAGEGLYDWLRHRDPRWERLAIVHRLDKDTSGLMVFTKSPLANRSLTEQFTQHAVRKKYVFLTDRSVPVRKVIAKSVLVRTGEKYTSRPLHAGGNVAETHFQVVHSIAGSTLVAAQPVTGRTHQIRAQAAAYGFPILGDTLYGGTPAGRVCLHAAELGFKHPETGAELQFEVLPDFSEDAGLALRHGIIDLPATNAYRLIHGAADGWPGWYVERLGDFLLSQAEQPLSSEQRQVLSQWMNQFSWRGVYHRIWTRQLQQTKTEERFPNCVLGEMAPPVFFVRENGLQFELSFAEGCSVGLFLDQRENRRRILTNHVAAGFPLFQKEREQTEVLNTFAYTCGFSVCAAKSGARVTSLDLSRKYLAWGKRNFAVNGLNATGHDFILGDAFDWLGRLAKKGRVYDLVILDPPTFSRSKDWETFRAEKDYGRLVSAVLPLLANNGVLFASTNAAQVSPAQFLEVISAAVTARKLRIHQAHYVPQPLDFPVTRAEPAYLKTAWFRIG